MNKEEIACFLSNKQKVKLIKFLLRSMVKNKKTVIKAVEFRKDLNNNDVIILRGLCNEQDQIIFINNKWMYKK